MMAIASHELHGHQDWIARQVLVDTADAEELERHASIWGIARSAAVTASGTVTFTGDVGGIVPAGSELRRADDVRYRTRADAAIEASGSVAAGVIAVEAGAPGDAPIGTKQIGRANVRTP